MTLKSILHSGVTLTTRQAPTKNRGLVCRDSMPKKVGCVFLSERRVSALDFYFGLFISGFYLGFFAAINCEQCLDGRAIWREEALLC